jgi:hypothetical protein
MPPGGAEMWQYLEDIFAKIRITVHFEDGLVPLNARTLYFNDGTLLP